MMIDRRAVTATLLLAGSGLRVRAASPGERFPVVASFPVLADMARQVGGERVEVRSLVAPGGEVHTYQPTPTDLRLVTAGRLLVLNGLGLEGWMTRLQRSAGFKGVVVTAAGSVPLRREPGQGGSGTPDPHAWQSLANGRLYVEAILAGLVKADPEGRETYRANAGRYLAAMDALEGEIRREIGLIPPARRRAITTHDAFGYFAAAYGIAFIAPQGVAGGGEASAQDVARIVRQIRAEAVPAVFLEAGGDPRLIEAIRRETGARIGGTLYGDTLSEPGGPAPTYLDMMGHNLRILTEALKP